MKKRAQSASLALYIDGRRITADRFKRAIEAFSTIVQEVSVSITGNPKAIEWIVSVREGSIGLAYRGDAVAHSATPAAVVTAAYKGIKQVQVRSRRPAHFSDLALNSAKELARLNDGKAIDKVQVRHHRNRVSVDQRAALHIDAIMGGTIAELGTIEGKLEMISARGGLHVGVWDVIKDRHVRCFIEVGMLEEAKVAFGSRVMVTGRVRYRIDGEPLSIEVDRILPFPDEKSLPTVEEMYGIFSST